MELKEKIEFLEEIMDIEEETLTEDTVLADIDEWDSLSTLSLMSEMKRRFGMKLTMQNIKEFRTVADICRYIPD